ncbi:hypothetical protein EDD86DRAFT_247959 [Gorgonomyces haynaldii]|nr:hypothetical protein EDD86DRAFT_247959 [Gorgonomyces haynaldii]
MQTVETAQKVWYAVPFGTALVMVISTILFMFNFFASPYPSLCLASTNTTSVFAVEFNSLVHKGPWHFIVSILLFPLASAGVEQALGTIGFLMLFLSGSLLTSLIYIFVTWFLSFFVPSWGYDCVGGLDIPFFMFLGIEGLSRRGLFEITTKMGLQIPDTLYTLPYLLIVFVLMPFSTWFGHLNFLGFLDPMMPTNTQLSQWESAGLFQYVVKSSNFVPCPGGVQLPMPGSYPDEMLNPRTNTTEAQGSFFTRIQNAFSKEKYQPISGNEHQEVDALLWDDRDEHPEQESRK